MAKFSVGQQVRFTVTAHWRGNPLLVEVQGQVVKTLEDDDFGMEYKILFVTSDGEKAFEWLREDQLKQVFGE